MGIASVEHISARGVVDFSPYGPDEMAHIGAGLDEHAFVDGERSGAIGQIGLLESAALLATALDLRVDAWNQHKHPVLADTPCVTQFVTVPAGRVRGFRQTVSGTRDGTHVIELQMVGLLGRCAGDGGTSVTASRSPGRLA